MAVANIDITSVGTDPVYGVGQVYRDELTGKTYKYVKYDDGTGNLDLAAGDVLHYIDDTGYEASTVGADVSDLTGKGIPAGTAVAAVTVDASYFWIQTKGVATLAVAIESSNDATPVACGDGDPIVLGDADKAARRENTTVDADTERVFPLGVAVDASAKIVVLNCID